MQRYILGRIIQALREAGVAPEQPAFVGGDRVLVEATAGAFRARSLKTLGIIQVPFGSAQRKKRLGRSLGGKPLLEWVVRSVTESRLLGGVIVALGDSLEERGLAVLVPLDVPVFFGSQNDLLLRFRQALGEYDADAVVRVSADNPFVDPVLIDRLVDTALREPGLDYVGYCLRDGRPVVSSQLGIFAEWFTRDALCRAHHDATDKRDRQQVTSYIHNNPHLFRIRLIPIPSRLDRDDVRLKVDVEEDVELAQEIYDALGPDDLNLEGIADFLQHQPGLRERMASLNRAIE